MSNRIIQAFLCVACLVALLPSSVVNAQTSKEELQEQIENQNEKIERINEEINQYESELDSTQDRKNTLENTVQSLNQSITNLQNRITNTENKISTVQNRIRSIEDEIKKVQSNLQNTKKSLSSALRAMHVLDSRSLVETFLTVDELSTAWRKSDQLAQVQSGLQTSIRETRALKDQLESKRQQSEQQQTELDKLRSELASQQSVINQQRERKRQLLNQTNRQAQEYQQILAEKRAQKEKFEKQLQTFEERLETTVSDAAVPTGDEVSFTWPVPSVRITQQFGGSAFAKRNPQAYGRPFHNGTDFGVPVGTPIKPVHAGQVLAVGNTDQYNGCYSYGKWVLVDHSNGLATLYAHLSNINVQSGESVTNDAVIGYSGNTGYSTGPHLHLTTYVSDDVQIRRLGNVKDETNCGPAEIPVAPQAGYLNSMKYLP